MEVIYDNRGEVVGKEFQEMLYSNNIRDVLTTVKNPQANYVIKRMHLSMGISSE